ncbi:FAD-dependent monooxygenase [Yinghuangia soli]|uniref:FAD-dependent monooxygenase n=1 Tax=Yinghuangia soli TaxID=2908204 RepID=A0AA41Q7L5_9ACTN|nr:FAD-dependent monooxygenase [Yinghuangia soli]MCF2533080.1 FAD-dependent monooxygenase [Yinghuangia soli]
MPGTADSPHHRDSVIIVGAGPAGLACALALARHGVRSVLVDAGDGRAREGSRSCGLEAATYAFAAGLAGGRLDGAAQPWGPLRIRRRSTTVPAPRAADGPADAGPAQYGLPQQILEQALLDEIPAHRLIATAWRHRVEGIEQDADSVTVTARGPGGIAQWRGGWLVAADGAHSAVRRALGVRFPGRPRVDRLLCADVKVALPRVPWDETPPEPWLFVDPPFQRDGTVLARPLPSDMWRLTWQLPLAHGVAKAADATALIPVHGDPADPARTAQRIRAVLRTLEAMSPDADTAADPAYDLVWSGEFEVHQRLARRFRTGRVLLAGDAAHLVHPNVADGVDLALQDARNLAWKLGLVLGRQAPERLVETYHGERRGAARRRLAYGEDALHFLAPRGAAQKVGRRLTLMGARSKGTTLRRLDPRALVADSVPEYAGSPLLTPGGPGVGALVEDVAVVRADGRRGQLSGCLDSGLVAVLVAPGIEVWDGPRWRDAGLMPLLRARLGELPVPAELVVTHGYPDAPAHTLLLVRPDGYLAAWLPPGSDGDDLVAAALRVVGRRVPEAESAPVPG